MLDKGLDITYEFDAESGNVRGSLESPEFKFTFVVSPDRLRQVLKSAGLACHKADMQLPSFDGVRMRRE